MGNMIEHLYIAFFCIYALRDAIINGDREKVTRLLDMSPKLLNTRIDEHSMLVEAIRAGHLDIVEILISRGANIHKGVKRMGFVIFYPIHYTADILGPGKQKAEILELLVSKGADINKKGDGGVTVLQLAASKGLKSVVEKALSLGADPTVKDSAGRTPLDWAEHNRHTDIASLLRKQGAKD